MVTRRNIFIVTGLLAILLGSAIAGRRMSGWLRAGAASPVLALAQFGANVIPNPDSLPAACRAVVRVTSVEKVETGNLSETFLVKWNTSLSCLTEADVTVTVTREDGSTKSDSTKVTAANQALVKVFGFREGNPAKTVRATVTAAGIQSRITQKELNL
jgi:predicted RNA-binding protein YlqC (UPF0109 family)